MSVKSSQSGARMLAVLEAIAAEQPIGVSALARRMGTDKSAIQRSIVTLAKAGWIAQTDERSARWELSAHLFTMARLPHSSEDLRRRATPALAELRERTNETAFLAIPDLQRFVVVEVAECQQLLRTVLRIGQLIPPEKSATSRAILSFLDETERTTLLGRQASRAELAQFEDVARKGYAVSVDEVQLGSTNIAAPIIGASGHAVAAITLSAPTERISADRHEALGCMVARYADQLSRSPARAGELAPA